MSVVYLSFGSIARLHNNSLLTVSPIGELTNKARTYAKDPGVFTLSTPSETVLFNFLSQRDGVNIVLPQAQAEVQINISDWLYGQAKINNITSSRPNTLALLKSQFTNGVEIVDIGEMVTNNAIWLPSFVKGNITVGAETHEFIMWMADAYFRDQYPIVSFTIVHPLPLTDKEMDTVFEMNYQELDKRLAKETPDVIEKRTKALTQDAAWPYTERNIISFQILDLTNVGHYSIGYWTYLEWGNGEDAEDQLLDQIQQEILANTDHTRPEWEEKIPDLFNPIEFYVVPSFNRLGLINKTNGAAQYSPIVDQETCMDLVNFYLTPNMTADHVIKSTQHVPHLYKSFSCAFVAKLNNREGMRKVNALYKDYSLIGSGDSDFGGMNDETTEFIRQMENLLAAAEIVTPISLPPAGITRIERFGKVCVAKRVGKAKYIVITRWQMVQDGLVEA